MEINGGVFTALITPFKNNEIDLVSLKRLIEHQETNGIAGFVVCGTTAESPTLSDTEKLSLLKFVRENTKLPIVMGTGSNCTRSSIMFSQKAEAQGAEALLVVVPYYNKPSQSGMVAHFKAIANAVKVPLILYNVPGRTVVSINSESVQKLSEVKNIVAIKEASGDLKFHKELLDKCPDSFKHFSGDDDTAIEYCSLGGSGVISVVSHLIPKEFSEFTSRAVTLQQDVPEYKKYLPLVRGIFAQPNPVPVKSALEMMGIIESDDVRLPLVTQSQEEKEALKTLLVSSGVLS